MNVARRLITGTVANSAGIGMRALVQFLTVPVLVTAWGQERLGLWIILTTIPTYFALTDLGFVQAATSDMTINCARGEKKAALATFQSIWLLFAGSSLIIICAASSLFVAQALIAEVAQPWIVRNAPIVVLLICYSALSLLSSVTVAGFRSTGNYAIGTLAYEAFALVEGLAGLLAAYLGGDFSAVIFTYIAVRAVSMVLLYVLLRRRVPWLHYGLQYARRSELKRLLWPALGAMVIPVALAINLQGVVLIIGAVLSPAAVALYTPVRTVSRIMVQLVSVFSRAAMPEIGRTAAEKSDDAMRKLIRLNIIFAAVILVPGGVLFATLGQNLVILWSGGHIVPPKDFVALMGLATVMNGTWMVVSNILLATNSQGKETRTVLASSLILLALSWVLAVKWALAGVAFALFVVETSISIAVFLALKKKVKIRGY